MKSIKGKIIFVNPASRIAAAYIGNGNCLVFEYQCRNHFKEGEMIDRLRDSYGPVICHRLSSGNMTTINVLSSVMDRQRAHLIVAPWQDRGQEEYPVSEYAFG